MITITQRRFLPDKLKITNWEILEPWYKKLLERKIESKADLENWLKDRSELEAFVSEDLAWRYVMTRLWFIGCAALLSAAVAASLPGAPLSAQATPAAPPATCGTASSRPAAASTS